MNDFCVEQCSVNGNCELFKLRRGTRLEEIRIYNPEGKTWKARLVLQEARLQVLISELLGENDCF